MVQTLYMDGPDQPPTPGTSPRPVPDTSAPAVGCSIEVAYRRKVLVVPKGEEFSLGPTEGAAVETLFLNACRSLPTRLLGVVRPGVRDQYSLRLDHHALGAVELQWRARRGRRLRSSTNRQLLLFSRECRTDSAVNCLPSATELEQACVFRVPFPPGRSPEVPRFFLGDRRSFRCDIGWPITRSGNLTNGTGLRRYPIAYDAGSESGLTGLPVHFCGPYLSDAERHGVSQAESLNGQIDEACKDALVDVLASYLIHRHGGAAMQVFLPTSSESNDRLLSELIEKAIRRRSIPLSRETRRSRHRRVVLGPRRQAKGEFRRIVLPVFTWDEERVSRVLADICPADEDQIDASVPPAVLSHLVGEDDFITFDENDAIGRLQPKVDSEFFPWAGDSDWQTALGKPSVVRRYLDVVWEAACRGCLEDEEEIALNAYMPDHSSMARPFPEVFRAVDVPRSLNWRESVPLVHPDLQSHRLLRRRAWKLRPFGLGDFLDEAKLHSAPLSDRRSFWEWLSRNSASVDRPTLRRITELPIWPAVDGTFRPLGALCEPRSASVGRILDGAICRPASQLLRSGLVGVRHKRQLRLRRDPTTAEITAFLVGQLSPLGVEQTPSPSARRDFHRFEDSLVELASEPGLRKTIREASDGHAVALSADGVLQPIAALVRADGFVRELHLQARHLIARPNRRLDRIEGWEPRCSPTTGQIVDALVEDGSRLSAHIPRLQEYVRQAVRRHRKLTPWRHPKLTPLR